MQFFKRNVLLLRKEDFLGKRTLPNSWEGVPNNVWLGPIRLWKSSDGEERNDRKDYCPLEREE